MKSFIQKNGNKESLRHCFFIIKTGFQLANAEKEETNMKIFSALIKLWISYLVVI